jgi:hypothetical protein
MRNIPVDPNRIRLISTGTVTPVAVWIELADGSRRPDPNGRQETDEHGNGVWRVEVVMPADEMDERDKTSVSEVTVVAKDRPDVGGFGDLLHFDGLVMSPGYVNRRTGQLTQPRWSASGVRKAQGSKQHQPAA